jgi:transposase-like protein
MMERNGEVRANLVPRADGETLKPIIIENVDEKSTIMSDEFGAYKDLADKFEAHYIVVHSRQQYVDGIVHTNNIENFWSMLKRGIYGIYHHVSKKHMNKYVDEFEY